LSLEWSSIITVLNVTVNRRDWHCYPGDDSPGPIAGAKTAGEELLRQDPVSAGLPACCMLREARCGHSAAKKRAGKVPTLKVTGKGRAR